MIAILQSQMAGHEIGSEPPLLLSDDGRANRRCAD